MHRTEGPYLQLILSLKNFLKPVKKSQNKSPKVSLDFSVYEHVYNVNRALRKNHFTFGFRARRNEYNVIVVAHVVVHF